MDNIHTTTESRVRVINIRIWLYSIKTLSLLNCWERNEYFRGFKVYVFLKATGSKFDLVVAKKGRIHGDWSLSVRREWPNLWKWSPNERRKKQGYRPSSISISSWFLFEGSIQSLGMNKKGLAILMRTRMRPNNDLTKLSLSPLPVCSLFPFCFLVVGLSSSDYQP